jgi:hypothetical protein
MAWRRFSRFVCVGTGLALIAAASLMPNESADAAPAKLAARSITLKISASSVSAGAKVNFTGSVTKSPVGTAVSIQRQSGKKWVTVKTVKTTTRAGAYAWKNVKQATRGTFAFRATVAKTKKLKAATSANTKLIVKAQAPQTAAVHYALSIFAGTGSQGAPTPGPAISSNLDHPMGVAVDSSGNVYIADPSSFVVEKVTTNGQLSIFAGTGSQGAPTPGPAQSSSLSDMTTVAVDPHDNVYIADPGNGVLEKVTPAGELSIYASLPSTPLGIAVDASGNVYLADAGHSEVWKVTPDGQATIFAGNGTRDMPRGDRQATNDSLGSPSAVAVDGSGNVYIADDENHIVAKVRPNGVMSIFAGVGAMGAPWQAQANATTLGLPEGVAADASGDVFIVDRMYNVVAKVTPDGMLSIIAGDVTRSGRPTVGPAAHSLLDFPTGVAVAGSGKVYIADTDNYVVEALTPAR